MTKVIQKYKLTDVYCTFRSVYILLTQNEKNGLGVLSQELEKLQREQTWHTHPS